jgi:putative flippase GtrA
MFTLMSQAVTILQLILMPVLKAIFNQTSLVNISFQFMGIPGAFNLDGSQYYIFDYAAGAIGVLGGGGGLGYFLAIEITLAIAQIINFFVQRNITFKSKSNPWIAAMWYLIAYIAITLIAGALQGLYKAPIYNSFTSSMGSFGTLMADFVTMIINSCISYWVFFPIFKIIFPQKKDKKVK